MPDYTTILRNAIVTRYLEYFICFSCFTCFKRKCTSTQMEMPQGRVLLFVHASYLYLEYVTQSAKRGLIAFSIACTWLPATLLVNVVSP